jgi:hypothetical protein
MKKPIKKSPFFLEGFFISRWRRGQILKLIREREKSVGGLWKRLKALTKFTEFCSILNSFTPKNDKQIAADTHVLGLPVRRKKLRGKRYKKIILNLCVIKYIYIYCLPY